MEKNGNVKVGVYVDVSNIAQNGGYGMHYDVLREFACRNSGTAIRLNAYVAYDEDEAKKNRDYRLKSENFHAVLRDFGFKVIVKKVKWFIDESGTRFGKANADLDMAVDMLLQSERLDYILVVTGDGDFTQVVRALQNRGCRLEVIAFKNVSHQLRNEADVFTSGYLVPELLPTECESQVDNCNNNSKHENWGDQNSRVRGICYAYNNDKGYGFLRYIRKIQGGMWITDSRNNESPYDSVFVHYSQFPEGTNFDELPNRAQIFEFKLVNGEKGLQATNLKEVYHY
jgi:uncharacterized LabA/DUF88 family protein/cold shock CspA family protein